MTGRHRDYYRCLLLPSLHQRQRPCIGSFPPHEPRRPKKEKSSPRPTPPRSLAAASCSCSSTSWSHPIIVDRVLVIIGNADKMKWPRFAQMRCAYSGQRQPIMRRASHLHSWDVFAYEPLPNRLRPSDLALGRLSKETNRRRSSATSRICRRREDSVDV